MCFRYKIEFTHVWVLYLHLHIEKCLYKFDRHNCDEHAHGIVRMHTRKMRPV